MADYDIDLVILDYLGFRSRKVETCTKWQQDKILHKSSNAYIMI